MAERIAMGVSVDTFEKRMRSALTEDTFDNDFKAGAYRGKVGGGKFYMYISENGPRNYTPVLKGKYDDKEINFHFSKPRAAIIFMTVGSLLWLIFSIVFFLMNGPIGLIFLLGIPIMLFPLINRKKNSDKPALVNKLRKISLKIE